VSGVIAAVFVSEGYTLYKLYRGMYGQTRYAFGASGGRHVSQRLLFYDSDWRSYDAALDWLASRTTAEDVIVTSAPHWAHLRTRAHAVQPPFEADAGKALELIEQVPATYVIVDAFTYPGGDVSRRYAAPALAAGASRWKLAFTSKDPPVRVYRRTK
jgi:hypothetical protein